MNSSENLKLRVCYSELNKEINCSKCEKCFRTIFGIILSNDNPNSYGFAVDENVYDKVMKVFIKGFKTRGSAYFWWEISEAISKSRPFFIFSNKEKELEKMKTLNNLLILKIQTGVKETSSLKRLKHKIINRFPKTFKIYLKFRQRGL